MLIPESDLLRKQRHTPMRTSRLVIGMHPALFVRSWHERRRRRYDIALLIDQHPQLMMRAAALLPMRTEARPRAAGVAVDIDHQVAKPALDEVEARLR